MSIPTVCAIVLDYYGAEITTKCLISLIGQGLKTIYVLDNSQKGEAAATLHKAVDQVRALGPDFEINVISAGSNLGFGKGVNFVIAHDKQAQSSHDYYLLLNNDAVAGPGLVVGLRQALERDPQAALAAPRVVSSDSSERAQGVWYHRYFGLLSSRPGRFRFHYFTGCCLLFSRHLVDDRSLFDEAFFMYGEDAELAWRLTRDGHKTIYAESVFIEHEYGPSVDRSSFFYEYHMNRCHILLSFMTWRHRAEIPVLVSAKYLVLFFRAATRSLRHRSVAPLLALSVASLPISASRFQPSRTG
jgi:N-acetylglucosaminyl-diphospho-decaprenol L-rhamnosyltransferase